MQNKVLAVLLLVMFIPLLSISYYSIRLSTDTLKRKEMVNFGQYAFFAVEKLEGFLEGIKRDILLLKDNPHLALFLEEEGQDKPNHYRRTLEDFLFLSHIRKIYNQIRYIDEKGQEVIRIDFDGVAHKILPNDELQNKNHRYYFQQTMTLPPDKIYVSPIDLNREKGKVEHPLKPMIRYAAPVYDKDGRKKGIIILNVFASYFFKEILEEDSLKSKKTFLINQDGFYLRHPDSSKEWGEPQNLNTGKNILKDYPKEIVSQILSGAPGTIEFQDEIILYARISLNEDNKDYLIYVDSYLKSEIFESVTIFKKIFSIFILFSLLIVFIISTLAAIHITKPIKELSLKVRKIEAGDLHQQVEIKTGDEIERLGNSFNQMVNAISRREHDLKIINQKLKNSEEKHKSLIDHAVDAIISIDHKGIIILFNPAASKLFGYKEEEVVGMNILKLMPFNYREKHTEGLKRFVETEKAKILGKVLELDGLAKSGEQIPISVSIWAQKGGNKYLFTAILRDAREGRRKREEAETRSQELANAYKKTERAYSKLKETQSQLLQSEKMASIGQLAAGIAHEINNPIGFINSNLSVLSGYGQDIKKLIDKYEKLRESNNQKKSWQELDELIEKIDLKFLLDDIENLIKESQEGTERVKKIVSDLRDFSHIDEAELKYTDINKGLESTLNIVWNEIKYKAEVIKEYGELPEILCYPMQLNQVFMNILVNAAQAIEKKGKIKIVTRDLNNGSIEICISDTGVGINKENLGKIFDPFFTTKEVGKGTGLGLSMAYGIIKKNGGSIKVESAVGKGTTFIITLPVKKE